MLATVQKMVADLQRGERIRLPRQDLQSNYSLSGVVEAYVISVKKKSEGWHVIETDLGELKPKQPTDKYSLVS